MHSYEVHFITKLLELMEKVKLWRRSITVYKNTQERKLCYLVIWSNVAWLSQNRNILSLFQLSGTYVVIIRAFATYKLNICIHLH